MNKKKKHIITAVIASVCVVFCAAAAFFVIKNNAAATFSVYDMSSFIMTGYDPDQYESYGLITSEHVQKIYNTTDAPVQEIYVTEGQEIKKGDIVAQIDTTLAQIALDKAEISVKKLEHQIETAQSEYEQLCTLVPHYQELVIPDDDIIYDVVETPSLISGTGSKEDPIYYLISEEDDIDDDTYHMFFNKVYPSSGNTSANGGNAGAGNSVQNDANVGKSVYAALVIRDQNALNGEVKSCTGIKITAKSGGRYAISLYVPEMSDEFWSYDAPGEPYYVDKGSEYTAEEIASLKEDKQQEITEAKSDLEMARIELKTKQEQGVEGNVVSTVDGIVKAVRDKDECLASGEPVIELTEGGGYYIDVQLTELAIGSVEVGQTVNVMSWNDGMTYEGVVKEISQYPSEEDESTNNSSYPMTVFVSGDANLTDGDYASVTYEKSGGQDDGFYIESMFVREEDGRSFVYVQGEDGLLEKKYVTTGGNLWGSYTKITGGLEPEGYIAFPYGKDIAPGAKTRIAEPDELYNY